MGAMNNRMPIDAARPVTMKFETRIRPPKEAWDRIRPKGHRDLRQGAIPLPA